MNNYGGHHKYYWNLGCGFRAVVTPFRLPFLPAVAQIFAANPSLACPQQQRRLTQLNMKHFLSEM